MNHMISDVVFGTMSLLFLLLLTIVLLTTQQFATGFLAANGRNEDTTGSAEISFYCQDARTEAKIAPVINENTVSLLSDAICLALQDGSLSIYPEGNSKGISDILRRALLLDGPLDENDPKESCSYDGRRALSRCSFNCRKPPRDSSTTNNSMLLFGFPSARPLYIEVARRLLYILSAYDCTSSGSKMRRFLLDASCFGMTENTPVEFPPLPQARYDSSEAIPLLLEWIKDIGDRGIRELLGLRDTFATIPNALPPPISILCEAARQPHKFLRHKSNDASASKYLTVAARAQAKHAHRGSTDKFFGSIQGGVDVQNSRTEQIISQLMAEAAWINCHTFGGGTSVVEIRVLSGYGARWSADWSVDLCVPRDVQFRGYLEPQMEDGHKTKWRH